MFNHDADRSQTNNTLLISISFCHFILVYLFSLWRGKVVQVGWATTTSNPLLTFKELVEDIFPSFWPSEISGQLHLIRAPVSHFVLFSDFSPFLWKVKILCWADSWIHSPSFGEVPSAFIMVLDGIIAGILNKYLSKYIKNLDSSNLDIGLLSGEYGTFETFTFAEACFLSTVKMGTN